MKGGASGTKGGARISVMGGSIMGFILFFLVGCISSVALHELAHVLLAEYFGGRVLSVRILGFSLYPQFTTEGFNWTGSVAQTELGFDPQPPWLESWLINWVPELLNLMAVILVPIVLIGGAAGDPRILAFLVGVFSVGLFGLLAVVSSFV